MRPSLLCALAAGALLTCAAGDARAAVRPAEERGLRRSDVVDQPYTVQPGWGHEWLAAGVGDVNGDGTDDVALSGEGSVRIVFGARRGERLPADPASRPGFVIEGHPHDVAGVGDVNGDGLGDVAVRRWTDVYVVFGRTGGGSVATFPRTDLGEDGYVVGLPQPPAWDPGWSTPARAGGSVWMQANDDIVPLGDQNGDGRADFAVAGPDEVRIVFTPAEPAGAYVDAAAPGTGGAVVKTGHGFPAASAVHAASLGDVDGDGRQDLAVAFNSPRGGDAHVQGVLAPAPGESVDLTTVAGARRGFDLHDGAGFVGGLLPPADFDGDGGRELAVVLTGLTSNFVQARLVPVPPLGTDEYLVWDWPGRWVSTHVGLLTAVGDQDGDGRPDLAAGPYVRTMRDVAPRIDVLQEGAQIPALPGADATFVVGALADATGDGRPELLVAQHAGEADGVGGRRGRVVVERWDSAPGGWPADPPGPQVPAAEPPVMTTPDPALFVPGRRPSAPSAGATPAAGRAGGPGRDRLVGGAGRDRLSGGRGDDDLRGRSGDDHLLGGPGADRLSGDAGRDVLDGGTGNDRVFARDRVRDVVRCGAGRDSVVADRRDRLVGCERRSVR